LRERHRALRLGDALRLDLELAQLAVGVDTGVVAADLRDPEALHLLGHRAGYQYTFDVERLWRKNLRDNDGNGEIKAADDVDPNRNRSNHFMYDEEGSSSIFSSQTYRGIGAVSEAETEALKGLLDRVDFSFQVNYHSNAQWLLYPDGWHVSTPTADDPIYFALSGNPDEPAIADLHPGLAPTCSTSRTARRPTTPTRRGARWRGRRSCRRAARAAASSSPTTRR
ncbi:MAG TPA: M14 family zinc carboxypeptidase, partial [Acidimicrobiia bacterium]|nr:M14 family zinc carboxypeptidase [Acidimicrobiia bacterium]